MRIQSLHQIAETIFSVMTLKNKWTICIIVWPLPLCLFQSVSDFVIAFTRFLGELNSMFISWYHSRCHGSKSAGRDHCYYPLSLRFFLQPLALECMHSSLTYRKYTKWRNLACVLEIWFTYWQKIHSSFYRLLHLSLLAFNALSIGILSNGSKNSKENTTAVLLVSSQVRNKVSI